MTTICLNMIVKNESHVIVETLENILAHIPIDYWAISDTGSTDNTVELIENFFKAKKIKGKIYHDQWVNFSHNRNLALDHCIGQSDYIFISDADDRFEGTLILPELSADAYELRMRSAEREFYFYKKLILKNNNLFQWVGVLHEGLIATQPNVSKVVVEGDYYVQVGHFGDRSKDPEKYLNDALLLEQNIPLENDHKLKSRYMFYCACSYHDAKMHEKAIEWFKQRKQIKLADFDEEQWLSFLHLGMQYEILKDDANAIYYWLQGFNQYPDRAESLYHVVRVLNNQNQFNSAFLLLPTLRQIQLPSDHGGVEKNVYIYGIEYESVRTLLGLNKYPEALDSIYQLILKPIYTQPLAQFIVNSLWVGLSSGISYLPEYKRQIQMKMEEFKQHFKLENYDQVKQLIEC